MKKLVITALMLTCLRINGMGVEDEIVKNTNLVRDLAGGRYRFIAFKTSEYEWFKASEHEWFEEKNSNLPWDSFLLKATIEGDFEKVQFFYNKGADVNTISIFGFSPLHEAALKNHTEIISFLLNKGADSNSTYEKSLKNIRENIPRFTHYPNFTVYPWVYFYFLQGIANKIYPSVVQRQLNNTPLHLAAQFGNIEAVQLLLEAGANPLAKNNANETPAELASNQQIKKYLALSEKRLQQAIKNLE